MDDWKQTLYDFSNRTWRLPVDIVDHPPISILLDGQDSSLLEVEEDYYLKWTTYEAHVTKSQLIWIKKLCSKHYQWAWKHLICIMDHRKKVTWYYEPHDLLYYEVGWIHMHILLVQEMIPWCTNGWKQSQRLKCHVDLENPGYCNSSGSVQALILSRYYTSSWKWHCLMEMVSFRRKCSLILLLWAVEYLTSRYTRRSVGCIGTSAIYKRHFA